jgi:hypothetical protein
MKGCILIRKYEIKVIILPVMYIKYLIISRYSNLENLDFICL